MSDPDDTQPDVETMREELAALEAAILASEASFDEVDRYHALRERMTLEQL